MNRFVRTLSVVALALGCFGPHPMRAALVFVPSFDNLSIIDSANDAVVATVYIGGYVRAIAVGCDKAYLTVELAGQIKVVSAKTRTVVASAPLQLSFPELALSPDCARLYVTTWSPSPALHVIDTGALTVIRSLPLNGSPSGLAVHPNGTRLYLGLIGPGGNDRVVAVSLPNLAISTTGQIPGGIRGLAISRDGSRLVAALRSSTNDVLLLDPTTLVTQASIALPGCCAESVAVSRDGTLAYVSQMDDGLLSVIDLRTRTLTTQTSSGGHIASAVDVHPDGTRVYVANERPVGPPSKPGLLSVFGTTTNRIVKTVPNLGTWPHFEGKFILPVSKSDGTRIIEPWWEDEFCPTKKWCRVVPRFETLDPCLRSGDPLSCLPPPLPCNPFCARIDCCGMMDPKDWYPDRQPLFISWVEGAKVTLAKDISVQPAGADAFEPLEKGRVLQKGDLLSIPAGGRLELKSGEVRLRTPKAGAPPGLYGEPYLLSVAGRPPADETPPLR